MLAKICKTSKHLHPLIKPYTVQVLGMSSIRNFGLTKYRFDDEDWERNQF